MAFVVGSYALKLNSEPAYKALRGDKNYKDIDLVMKMDEFKEWIRAGEVENNIFTEVYPIANNKYFAKDKNEYIYEIELVYSDTAFDKLYSNTRFLDTCRDLGYSVRRPNLDFLFTLKKTHRFLKNSPHFYKNIEDYHYLKKIGCIVPDCLQDFFIQREKETYTHKTPKLNLKKSEFFTDKYPYDHDSIHKAVAHRKNPAYTYYKSKNTEVMCSEEDWNKCSQGIKLFGVLEECYVLALERHQIPNDFKPTPRDSFRIAFSKVATSITGGFFREFAYENYYKVFEMYKDSYVDKFRDGLSRGIVKKL